MWREEKKPAATSSVHGQGRGPAGARAHSPQRPPRRPPTSFLRGKAPPVNPHTTRRRQNGSPSAAGRRTRGRPEPTATAHTARAHPPEGRHGTCARRTRRRPSPRGEGRVSLDRLGPHPTNSLRTQRAGTVAATGGGGAGGGSDTPPLGLGHLRDNPERSRSTAKTQAEPALVQRPRGQHDGPAGQHPHRRGGGRPREATTTRGESEGCLLRQRTPPTPAERHEADGGGGTARSGRVPHPSASQRTAHRRGRETGGPRGRDEKNGSHSP